MLLGCHAVSKSFGARTLFRNFTLVVGDGERHGLFGPNGSGKSTLLKLLAGVETPDEGTRSLKRGARVAYVPQDSVFAEGESVEHVLRRAAASTPLDDAEQEAAVQVMLGKAGFTDASAEAARLSGGWRKRLAIAEAWIGAPDALLLDEPTNHLDTDGIRWLEGLLTSSPRAAVVISHDRYFLETVATHMAEINRAYPDGLFSSRGNYSAFLEKREEFFEAQAKQRDALAVKVRREVEWLRRGPKARTGKSKARIDSAHELIGKLGDAQSRAQSGSAQIDFSATERKTKRLVSVENISRGDLFRDVSFVLSPGVRLGLAGANGSGKTSLLRILKGEWEPDAGTVERAELLRVASFDQNRNESLDPESTLRRALCPHGDSVIYNGRPIHVAGWAARFLFGKEQLEMPVGSLSGGEKARVLVAQLMLQPADLLLLDEPTNDLDIPTLEILEDSLLEFPGAIVLVTHDRYLLDRVSTQVLGLDGKGGHGLFADFEQWEASRAAAPAEERVKRVDTRTENPRKKLSYKDQRELDGIEGRIVEAEAALEAARREVEEAARSGDAVRLQEAVDKQDKLQEGIDALYVRWSELEVLYN